MIRLIILCVSLILGAQCEETISSTPAAPVTGNLGGTLQDRVALFEQFLANGKPEQMAAYRDDNPILKEVQKVFNKTLQTVVNGYAVEKSMLTSQDSECDRKAIEKADIIMNKAFDDLCAHFIQFRLKVRSEVKSDIMDIREVPQEQRANLILPIHDGFEETKTNAIRAFGQNTVDHIICSKKLKIPN